jgi:hypothetical protein
MLAVRMRGLAPVPADLHLHHRHSSSPHIHLEDHSIVE